MAPHTNRIEQLYGEKEGKPITLAETSAPFRYHQVRPGLGLQSIARQKSLQDTPHPLQGDCDEITIKVRHSESMDTALTGAAARLAAPNLGREDGKAVPDASVGRLVRLPLSFVF